VRSKYGLLASAIFLLSIPVALLVQVLLGNGAEAVLHFAFAAGSGLLGVAALSFRMPVPIRVIGAIATGLLALIFFLQGLSDVLQNASLSWLALDLLGQRPERLLIDALLLLLAAILFYDSSGRTRILGAITVGGAIAVEAYNYWLNYLGTTLDAEFAILKIALLLPFFWLLIESRKRAVDLPI